MTEFYLERRLELERSNVVDQYPQDVYSGDSEEEDVQAYATLCRQVFGANGRSSEDEEELWAALLEGQSSPSTMDEGDADTGDSELELANDVESKRKEKRRPVSTANRVSPQVPLATSTDNDATSKNRNNQPPPRDMLKGTVLYVNFDGDNSAHVHVYSERSYPPNDLSPSTTIAWPPLVAMHLSLVPSQPVALPRVLIRLDHEWQR